MPIDPTMAKRFKEQSAHGLKRGADIFAGTDYPADWDGFIGQDQAKEQLQVAIASANARGRRLDHTLLASGLHGIGKTTLAQITAYQAGAGLVTVSGPITVEQARSILINMVDGDMLFWDEFHLAVAGNRNKADWMLPFMTDGVLITAKKGTEQMPDVTIIAATTDIGKLPQTIISRFMVRPHLEAYTIEQATLIAKSLSLRMEVNVGGAIEQEYLTLTRVALAANRNPREMRMILTAVRDLATIGSADLEKAFKWAGVTHDGLSREAQDILKVLVYTDNYTASSDTIAQMLGEPGTMRHHEQSLLQKGFIGITGRGRVLTDEGAKRAKQLITEES